MVERKAEALVDLLSGPTLRCRTGILLLPKKLLGQEANIAARLGMDAVDYREVLVASLPSGTSFVDIDQDTEFARLDHLTTDVAGSPCFLVCNMDLALAKLDHSARGQFWDAFLHKLSRRPRAPILAMPDSAEHLLPKLDLWDREERIAVYTSTDNQE